MYSCLVGVKPSRSKPHAAGCLVAGSLVTTCSVGVTWEHPGGWGERIMTGPEGIHEFEGV